MPSRHALALADGTVFHGRVSVPKGAPWVKWYSTCLMSYQEILSPIRATAGRSLPYSSRSGQHGVERRGLRIGKIHAAGLGDPRPAIVASNWRAQDP